jgi:hypothetical protein
VFYCCYCECFYNNNKADQYLYLYEGLIPFRASGNICCTALNIITDITRVLCGVEKRISGVDAVRMRIRENKKYERYVFAGTPFITNITVLFRARSIILTAITTWACQPLPYTVIFKCQEPGQYLEKMIFQGIDFFYITLDKELLK